MDPSHDTELVKWQYSKDDESIPDPPFLIDSPDSSDVESLAGSEYERYRNAIGIDADIASSHETNYELRERVAVESFFETVKKIDTFKNSDERDWVGSLPSKMFKEPIPLFTDFDTGTDYQLHFSYTKMRALPTYTSLKPKQNDSDNVPDYYVHSLLHISNGSEVDLVSELDMVIPLGKLFVNESGRSKWTGYEVFVSSDMAIWMIYALDENDMQNWDPADCSLSRVVPVPGSAKAEQTGKAPGFKLACLWHSLKTLDTATFKDAAILVGASQSRFYMGTFQLLEISMYEVSRALSSSSKLFHRILETRKLRVNAESRASKQLLSLATRFPEKSIFKLKFENQVQSDFDDYHSLQYLVTLLDDGHTEHFLHEESIKDSLPFQLAHLAHLASTNTNPPHGHLKPDYSKSSRSDLGP